MVACDGAVSGTCEYAWVKTTDSRASVSRFGVSPSFEPRNPMRSARTVSTVIRMIFGGMMFGDSAAPSNALAANQTTHTNWRMTDMVKSLSSENFVLGGRRRGKPRLYRKAERLTLRHLHRGAWLQPVPARHLSSVPTDHRHRSEAHAARGHSAEARPRSLTLAAPPRHRPRATKFAPEAGSLGSDSDRIRALSRTA